MKVTFRNVSNNDEYGGVMRRVNPFADIAIPASLPYTTD